MNLDLLKNWRIILMIAAVVFSIILIGPSLQKGAVVTSVPSDSPFYGKVTVGELITWANEKPIENAADFYAAANSAGSFRFIHNGQLQIVELSGPADITVSDKPSTNMQFGLDLVGGTRVLLQPEGNITGETIEQIIATLETRVNVFGLKEVKFQPVDDVSGNRYVQIEMAGGSQQEIEDLLARQGYFEAKIPKNITFAGGSGTLNLNSNYTATISGEVITLEGVQYSVNDTGTIEGIPFHVTSIEEGKATLFFTVFTGDDVQSVCMQDQPGICTSRVMMVQGGYEFDFQVFLTQSGAQRFAAITKDMGTITSGTEKYLDESIHLYMDKNEIDILRIGADLKGQIMTSPSITGFAETRDEAVNEQLRLKSILQSGSLPTTLKIIRVDQISPSLGAQFFQGALIAALVAEAAVAGVIFFRYREKKILLQMMLWSMAELTITLGIAAAIKQTIDLSAIAGLIAAIGMGTNDQIIMIDEMLSGGFGKSASTMKQRIKRSFFIIFGAAGTVFAAMLPMMFVGIGVMRGFAIVTTIGIGIGILITRPAFPIVAEKLLGKKLTEVRKEEPEVRLEKDNVKVEEKHVELDSVGAMSMQLFGKSFGELTKEQRVQVKEKLYSQEKK